MFERRQFMKMLGLVLFSLLFPLFGNRTVSQAAERTVDLVDFHVAGFQYHQGMKGHVMASLTTGTEVPLIPEPRNRYDDKAIAIVARDGAMIGYIPRDLNRIPAALLDQQIPLRAVITAISRSAQLGAGSGGLAAEGVKRLLS